MPRYSYNRQTKLTDLKGRIDYIANPDRQEHLYTTYTTTNDPDFWNKLIDENRREYEKYNCKGKMIKAREWVIALEESLVKEDLDKIIRAFVDAFKETYGVECIAALHHNTTKSNYHIHLIFSEKQLLEEPVTKIADRNKFYDEKGKHRRTKKEICDEQGNIREGCKIISKGDVYEQTLFRGKNQQFKTKHFTKEAKELFTQINNGYIREESRKLKVFDSNSVYLLTKKISKNNPKKEEIEKDNILRKEWNETAATALVTGVPENMIRKIKKEQISDEVKQSILSQGKQPDLFAQIMKLAIQVLVALIGLRREQRKSLQDIKIQIPPAPVKSKLAEKIELLQSIKKELDRKLITIQKTEKELEELKGEYSRITRLFKGKEKDKILEQISRITLKVSQRRKELSRIVNKNGYATVKMFMRDYNTAKVDSGKYITEMQEYERQYAGKNSETITMAGKIKAAKERSKEHSNHKNERKNEMDR